MLSNMNQVDTKCTFLLILYDTAHVMIKLVPSVMYTAYQNIERWLPDYHVICQ